MIAKSLLTLALLSMPAAAAWADDGHTFPAEGKIYTINRFKNANGYLYESANLLYSAPSSTTQKQYWQFIPTANDNCYYIQNVTTKRYIQSSNVGESVQVKTGTEPVEYRVAKDETSGSTYGYYYLCSTDQTISTASDVTYGLNMAGGSAGSVVAYFIKSGRGNSYWEITETTYDYQTATTVSRTELAKRLGIYNQPCGTQGAAWLTSCTVTGDGVTHEMHYAASSKPSDYWMPIRSDSAVVVKGEKFTLAYTTQAFTSDYTATAYFDWDGNGIFEAKQEFFSDSEGTAEIEVPEDAVSKRLRMRIRLADDATEDAEEDIHGVIYDFQLFVTVRNQSPPTAISTPVSEEPATNGPAYSVDGKRVNPLTHKGVIIQGKTKAIK